MKDFVLGAVLAAITLLMLEALWSLGGPAYMTHHDYLRDPRGKCWIKTVSGYERVEIEFTGEMWEPK